MAQKPAAPRSFEELATELQECFDSAALFKLATSESFKADSAMLPETDLQDLRAAFTRMRQNLDGKVKLETFEGQTLSIIDVDFWHSPRFQNDGVTLKYRAGNDAKVHKSMTSAVAIVRVMSGLDPLPTEDKPFRCILTKEPVENPRMADQKMWRVKRLPDGSASQRDLPF